MLGRNSNQKWPAPFMYKTVVLKSKAIIVAGVNATNDSRHEKIIRTLITFCCSIDIERLFGGFKDGDYR